MYTQCPDCKTVFRLHLDQLNAAQGKVRCSRCHTVFNALDNLFQQPASDTVTVAPPETATRPATEPDDKLLAEAKGARSPVHATPAKEAPETESPPAKAPPTSRHGAGHLEKSSKTSTVSRPDDTQSAQEKPSRPKTATKGRVATRKAKSTNSGAAPRREPTSVGGGKKPVTSTTQTPSSPVEETLPLFGSDEALPRAPADREASVEQPEKITAKAPAEPTSPLFEFNSVAEEPLFDTTVDAGETTADVNNTARKKRPSEPPPNELDLFDWDATADTEPAETLLFHYLPEEEHSATLLPHDTQTDDGHTSTKAREKEQKTKPSLRGGYTLPLEQESVRGSLKGTLLWGIGIVLMLAGLALQYLHYHRMSLAGEPRLRPLLTQMCKVSGCQLPPQRDLARIELSKHLVQVHPRYENSLLITAILLNRSDFPQPFPVVEVVMTDLEQKQVARRRFLPREYLIGGHGERLLAPVTEVPLMLEVLDPGKNAVGFEFNFY